MHTTLPDQASAEKLAKAVIEARLAACVSLQAPCQSVYRWQGSVEQSEEIPLLIKTSASRYAELEAFIRARHPYELPEIIGVEIAHGLPAYLSWLADATSP